jgi:four helix bundle protein
MKSELRGRTKKFSLGIIKLCEALPKSRTAEIIGRQLLRSGTSVGANYRSAKRARSKAEFIAKMGIVEEESDECLYWMELLIESGMITEDLIGDLMNEADEILAMSVASIKTARRRKEGN